MAGLLQDMHIGNNSKKLRKAAGLTQKDICTKLPEAGRPMLRATYAQIETGKRNIF